MRASAAAAVVMTFLGLVADSVFAATDDPAAVLRGRAVAAGAFEGGARALACLYCHGLDGRGEGTAAFPRLAGQSAPYLYSQLRAYAAGTRPNAVMTPIARALDDGQMRDVSAYYAVQDAPYFPPPNPDPFLVQRGSALSAVGSPERGVQACAACHGPAGIGAPPDVPYLAGQDAAYLALQLRLWQEGGRDAGGAMAEVARRMGPEDVEASAAYFAPIRPFGN